MNLMPSKVIFQVDNDSLTQLSVFWAAKRVGIPLNVHNVTEVRPTGNLADGWALVLNLGWARNRRALMSQT